MLRELTSRESSGLTVTLLWEDEAGEDELALVVEVKGFGGIHTFEAPTHDLELAFEHPFAYRPELPNPFAREQDGWVPEMPDFNRLDDGEEELAPVS